jgi:hypothetical protein
VRDVVHGDLGWQECVDCVRGKERRGPDLAGVRGVIIVSVARLLIRPLLSALPRGEVGLLVRAAKDGGSKRVSKCRW